MVCFTLGWVCKDASHMLRGAVPQSLLTLHNALLIRILRRKQKTLPDIRIRNSYNCSKQLAGFEQVLLGLKTNMY